MVDVEIEGIAPGLARVLSLSPWLREAVEREPSLAVDALANASSFIDRETLMERYRQFTATCGDLTFPERLRRLRLREMMRIVYRDLSRISDLSGTTGELSHLADYCVAETLEYCYEEAVQRYGTPRDPDGNAERLVVLAMGKLGAFELNLSSDIDLIFFYTHPGELTLPEGRQLSHQEFFLRLARRVIACLDDASAIGQVFRVDMRLRPYGDSGPLVLHRAAMEKYYIEQGRDWERYAFIKARVMAGDEVRGNDFLRWMKPFVFRRNLDFSAVQSLREMKGLITRQVEQREMSDDLKLGPGGIREIEFIAQAHQLIYGGRYPVLQQPALMVVLEELRTLEFLPGEDVEALSSAYRFLRNSEHAVQAEHDRQTHRLPTSEESRSRLAEAMGFSTWAAYVTALDEHRGRVSDCFSRIVSGTDRESDFAVEEIWQDTWHTSGDESIAALREEFNAMELTDEVRLSVSQLMPKILKLCAETDNELQARRRMMPVVSAILRRSTYVVFLNENPDALKRSVQLAGVSSWIADQLKDYPILLYELSDRSIHDVAVTRQELEGKLRELMRTVEAGDLESGMDTLRQFRRATMLKIAAMELLDELSIMQTSDGLTALAEVILDSAIETAWHHLETKHGLPSDSTGEPLSERIAVIAYGKAGGLELAYGSDLDLVLLCPDEISGTTDGKAPINNNMFFVRLGQRLIHILTSFTRFGVLYTADLRLRPQGNKGPLVSTIGAFRRYQEGEAWTWEHQALIRARFVAGDASLGERFDELRREIVQKQRDRVQLRSDVLDMREKMRVHLASGRATDDGIEVLGRFDLKHDLGAIVDIEFMVQYAVLGWAAEYPALSRWTDVMRLLDELAGAGIFPEDQADTLQRAYLAFRAAVHHEWLGLETDYDRLQAYRREVQQIWEDRMLAGKPDPGENQHSEQQKA